MPNTALETLFERLDVRTPACAAPDWSAQAGTLKPILHPQRGRGARNGQVAWQFALDWAGRQ
jgi:predicted AAA+ superfamily ATPase